MLRGSGDYRIERWLAGGAPLVTVRSSSAPGSLPAVVVYHGFAGKKTDDLLGLAVPLTDAGCLAVLPDAADPAACSPTPLLMIHGTADHAASYPNARYFYDTLVPSYSEAPERPRFIDVPGEDHKVGAYWFEETLARLGRFL